MLSGNATFAGPGMRTLIVAIALTASAGIAGVQAQTFPTRPVTMIVPFPAAGPADVLARIMSERMRISLGQSVIVENVSGAAGSLAVGRVARPCRRHRAGTVLVRVRTRSRPTDP